MLRSLVGSEMCIRDSCKTCRSLRELDNQGTYRFCCFLAVAATGGRVRSFARIGEPLLRTRGMIGSRRVYGKAPMRLHSNLISVSGSGHTGKKINAFDAVIHMQESPPHKRFFCVKKVALHATRRTPHVASRLVQAVPAWSVKTQRAPSRHCRDARVYGHDYGHARHEPLSLIHI